MERKGQGKLHLHFTERENEAQRAGADASGNGARQGQSWGSIPGALGSTWSLLETETDRISLITNKSPLAVMVLGLCVHAMGIPMSLPVYPGVSL